MHSPSKLLQHVPWWLRPVFARGQFSPRLLLGWQAFYLGCGLCVWAAAAPPTVVNGVVVPRASLLEYVVALFGVTVTALGLGTYQTVKLGDTPVAGPPPESEPLPAEDAS